MSLQALEPLIDDRPADGVFRVHRDVFRDEATGTAQFRGRHLEMVRVHDHVVDVGDEQLAAGILPQRRRRRPHEAATSRLRLDDPFRLELPVGLSDRVAVDAKVLRQRADGGERITRPQQSRGGGGLHLVDQLKVDGLGRLEVDLEQHVTAYCHMTVGQFGRVVK